MRNPLAIGAALGLLSLASLAGCGRSVDQKLVAAANRGDTNDIRNLLQQGANPQALAADGWTALTMAAREGHLEAVDLLVRSGANVDAPEGGGNTALYWAAFYDHRVVAKFLLSKGADPDKKGNDGETPLHAALRLNHLDVSVVIREAAEKNRWRVGH